MTNKAANAGTRKETKKTKKQVLAERRKIREDLGSDRSVMTTPELPGMVVRWVNDEIKGGMNRIDRLKQLGWKLYDEQIVDIAAPNSLTNANVSTSDGTMVAVGLTREGKQMNAMLMCIPRDAYEADQELKEEAIREKEEAILEQGQGAGMYGGVRIGNG